jgi:23S rRNA pseudouridine1911/1915/1917 synthase
LSVPPLEILHEDAHLLAVAKPAGVLTQRNARGEAGLEDDVRRRLRADDPNAYLGTVHRLDRPVSGVILWAKTPKAARRLAEQFARREVTKEYWAVVAGEPEHAVGVWEDWLCHDETGTGRAAQVCLALAPGARQAVTRFQMARAKRLPESTTWLRLWPETGRTHQLRVQSATRNLPILGDVAYGAPESWGEGIALHAALLRVRHPVSGERLEFRAPVPKWWSSRGIELGATDPSAVPAPAPAPASGGRQAPDDRECV